MEKKMKKALDNKKDKTETHLQMQLSRKNDEEY
jgi:hypothetical protein